MFHPAPLRLVVASGEVPFQSSLFMFRPRRPLPLPDQINGPLIFFV